MPAIKKKWIKENQNAAEAESNGGVPNEAPVAEDTLEDAPDHDVTTNDASQGQSEAVQSPVKAKKRELDGSSPTGMLRGLDSEVLSQKRKRCVPPAESKLNDWLDANFESKEEVTVSFVQMYKHFTALCQGDASDILDVPAFNRMIKTKFGKGFGIKEGSGYKTILKEQKKGEKKIKPASGISLTEVAHEAIKHYGNPWNGVRFFNLKQYIATKYPALGIDQRPKTLKRILEMGVGYKKIELVKGIGMAGFYRLPGAEPPKPKPKQEKKDEDSKEESQDESSKGETKETDGTTSDTAEPKEKNDSAETDEATKDAKDEKPKVAKPKKTCNLSKIRHGNPQRIEDTFPLAITFQSAPKAAYIPRVRRYIEENYRETVQDNRWRKAIEKGTENGSWEYVGGSGITGRLLLLMDDFDPDSEHLEDQICAGIIACHEPKSASGNQIKKYISRYHPDFNVDERPKKFKTALIKAAEKTMIVQVSGLGSNGSFQLCSSFVPSPTVLSGQDPSSSEEDDDDEDEPVYIPKGTKSRGAPKKKQEKKLQPVVAKKSAKVEKRGRPRKDQANNKKNSNAGRKRKVVDSESDQSDEESSEEEEMVEYTPRKTQSRGGPGRTTLDKNKNKSSKKQTPTPKTKKAKKRSHSPEDESENDDDDDDGEPKSKRGRGRPSKSVTPKKQTNSAKKPSTKSKSPVKSAVKSPTSRKSLQYQESEDDLSEDEPAEYSPRKSQSRGGKQRGSPAVVSSKKVKKKSESGATFTSFSLKISRVEQELTSSSSSAKSSRQSRRKV